jgi:hypothetical protein
MLKLLQTCGCWLLVLLCPALVQAFPMNKVTIPLGHPANGSMLHLAEQQQLWVSGFSQYERWLTQVDLSNYQTRSIAVPEQAQYFSQAKLAGQNAEQLVLLTLDGILQLEQRDGQFSWRQLLRTESMFRVIDPIRLRERDFSLDLGSGLSDFLIPDFQAYHLYRQQADGSFRHYALPVSARIQTWNNNRADYSGRRFYPLDANLDGLTDLLFVQEGKMQIFLQQSDGSFNTTPWLPGWPVTLSTEQQADQRSDAGRSYSGQNISSLEEVRDLDGDGIPDLVVRIEQIADALERSARFQVYFGQKTEAGLSFPAQFDTEIKVDSVPTEVVIADFNGDGRADFYIPTTKIGVGTIVRVLLRGSANLDVDFYLLAADRRYPEKANFRQQAKIEVSISNLRFDMPLFELVDLRGDGRKHLVLGEAGNELRFFAPDARGLFSRSSDRVQLVLPRDASRVRVFDLTGDGKSDLVLPYDSLDAEGQRNQLVLLFSANGDAGR